MIDPLDALSLKRIVLGWLGCTAGVVAREMPAGDVADVELIVDGARLAYLDIHPDLRAPDAARDHDRRRRQALGVLFLPVCSLLDARHAFEDLGVLDRRGA